MKFRCLLAIATLPWMTACSDGNGEENGSPTGGSNGTETGGSNGTETGGSSNGLFAFCAPADTCPPDTTGVDLETPVSFRSDVFEPIFQASCNSSICHGMQATARAGLWLGPASGDVADEMLADIISAMQQPSAAVPSMKNVEPQDPSQSFLMLKVDGCQHQSGLTCTRQTGALCQDDCGDGMPQFDSPASGDVFPISAEQRHTIRAWIAQGAQNN